MGRREEVVSKAGEGEKRKAGGGGKGADVGGVARWSAEERATVLGLLCDEASMTGIFLNHMEVGLRLLAG